MRQRIPERWWAFVLCSLVLLAAGPVVLSTVTVGGVSPAWAAEDELEPAKDAGKSSAARKAVEDKSDALDLGVKKAGGAANSDEAPAAKESFLTWLYRSLTLRYVVIFLIITFNGIALTVMIVLGLRRNLICPDELATAFEAKLNEKQYQEAYDLAKRDRSVLGKVLAAGMSRLSDGYDAAQEAMQEVGEEQNMKLEQRNGYIALIAQIGPMFGLLGTVDGMVQAFDVIAHSNVTPKPSELAQGIGTALVTTVVGLWIAIPAIAFYHVIRNRLAALILETGTVSGKLMKRFATVQTPAKKS
jgi:biopolymer transport protein ExbB